MSECASRSSPPENVDWTIEYKSSIPSPSFEDTASKFDSKAKIFIEHTKGYVKVGKISIIIAVGCNHRKESFKICRYIIEEIKYKSPIWKKEHYLKGKQKWLPGFSLRNKK